MADLIEAFNIRDLNRSDAIVDLEKLGWFNRQHVNLSSNERLVDMFLPSSIPRDHAIQVVGLMKGRVDSIADLPQHCAYFFVDPDPPARMEDPIAAEFVSRLHAQLCTLTNFTRDSVAASMNAIKTMDRQQARSNMMTARKAITGVSVGAPLADTMAILGRETVLRRLARSISFPT